MRDWEAEEVDKTERNIWLKERAEIRKGVRKKESRRGKIMQLKQVVEDNRMDTNSWWLQKVSTSSTILIIRITWILNTSYMIF